MFAILSLTFAFCWGVQAESMRDAAPAQPDVLQRAGATRPFFISARLATDENGEIRWAVFPESTRIALQTRIDEMARTHRVNAGAAASEPCSTRTVSFPHVGGPHRSWSDLADNAEAIYRGRVVATMPGFEFTAPKTLLSIHILSRIRGNQAFPAAGAVNILYPAADFTIGDTRFCNAGPNAPFIPAVGDDVLIFAYDEPVDQSKSFLLTVPEQLIFSRDGRLIAAPEILRGKESSSIDELARSLDGASPLFQKK
jgi:hypothetical protein